jgi:hypothetical protein
LSIWLSGSVFGYQLALFSVITYNTARRLFLLAGYCAPKVPIPCPVFERAASIDHEACREALAELTGARAAHERALAIFAKFLRNNGDIYTLQRVLGHTSLDMVRRYLQIVQADLDNRHKSASPVKNWHL